MKYNACFQLGLGLLMACSLSQPVLANNLDVSRFDMSSINAAANTMTFTFDLSQANSWRNVTSHDAVWLFMKYSTDAGQTWHHASMAGNGLNPHGFSAPTNFEIVVPNDETGFFLRRTDLQSGNIALSGLKCVWDYGQDGLSDDTAAAANTITRIFGVEMAYVQEGAFYAGDGNSASEYRFKQGSSDDDAWYITGENAISVTNAALDGFYYQSSGSSGESASGSTFLIANSFPKGYRGFYVMKYELTEGQWVSFFNTLTPAQKLKRDVTAGTQGGKNSDGVVNRNTISWDSSNPVSNATTERPARAMTYVSWPDVAAYADWAGLRPLTELEYEKTARGVDVSPLADEYVWGQTTYDAAGAGEIYPSSSDEDGTEAIFDGTANVNRNTLGWTSGDGRAGGPAANQKGALRVGIFAENGSTRSTSGAGYYGHMELSGNVAEPVVTVGRSEGRQFLGSHGDGNLTTISGYEGNATNGDWPGINSAATRGVTSTVGIGYRGGDYQSASLRHFQTSSRAFAAKDPDSEGYNQRFDAAYGVIQGGRLGRTAP